MMDEEDMPNRGEKHVDDLDPLDDPIEEEKTTDSKKEEVKKVEIDIIQKQKEHLIAKIET